MSRSAEIRWVILGFIKIKWYVGALDTLSPYICTNTAVVKLVFQRSAVKWFLSFVLSLGVFLHRPHEACKCVICTAGANRCAFLVFKPLKLAFDFPLLSAVHWYHLAEVESEWAGVERRGGEALHCLINHANDWWGVRGPLTCSQTPQSAILLRAQTLPQMGVG